MSLDVIRELPLNHWRPDSKDLPEGSAENWLESGKVLFFPRLRFDLSDAETRFVAESWANGKAKNISYRGHQEPLRGAQGSETRPRRSASREQAEAQHQRRTTKRRKAQIKPRRTAIFRIFMFMRHQHPGREGHEFKAEHQRKAIGGEQG